MNPISRFFAPVGRLFGADTPTPNVTRLPAAPRPRGDGIIEQPEQSGAAGLVSDFAIDRFAVALTRMADPDDILKRAGLQRHDLRRLEFDDEIGGALETRRDAAITSQWRIDDGSEEVSSEPVKFIEAEIKRVFDAAMSGFWQAVPYGYSVSEAVYKPTDDGRIGFARVSVKPMQWFEPLRDGRLVMVKPGEGTRVDLDTRFKFCLMSRSPTYANPYGEALLSRLYWPWYFRHAGWKAWMQFVDRFGDPFVVGKSGNPKELVEALLGMGVRNVIGVGTDDQLDVLMQQGDSTFDRLDSRLTQRIVKMILGQTLTSDVGSGGSGSFALGKVHESVRQDKRLSDCRLLAGGGQWMVNALWAINRFPGEPPRFVFADHSAVDTEAVDRDVALKNAGMAHFSKEYLMRTHGFKSKDIEVPDPKEQIDAAKAARDALAGGNLPAAKGAKPGAPGAPGAPQPPQSRGKLSLTGPDDEHTPRDNARQGFTREQEAIEELADSVLDDAPESPISTEDMRLAIMGAKDAEDLEERLAALIERQSPKFAETLAQAMFAASILGYIHAEEG
jgi:phage gp29-like protein